MCMRVSILSSLLGAALVVVGCSATPSADDAHAVAAISAAEASGAKQVPAAALYLKMAEDGVARARMEIDEGREEEARETLERASADAELARTLTTEAKVRSEADVATQSVEQLKSRMTTF